MFGGAMACLADPIAALACARVFPAYRVWTRDLHMDFRHEGRSDLELRFTFDHGIERSTAAELQQTGRANPVFEYAFYDRRNRVCAGVRSRVAIRPAGNRPADTAQEQE